MRPYGSRHSKTGPCACCIMPDGKKAVKRRERNKAKKQIKKDLKENEL